MTKRYLIQEVFPGDMDYDDGVSAEELINAANQLAQMPSPEEDE